jgi:aspartyl protease family protein
MNGDDSARLIYGLMWSALLISSLAARRLPLGQTLKMATAWIAIFAGMFVLFSFRHEAGIVWDRVKAEVSPGGTTAQDGSFRIRKAEGGHFYVDAEVNGRSVRFMVDSGATITSLSTKTAQMAGVDIDMSGFPVVTDTANGIAESRRGRVARFSVGPISRADFPVLVSDTLGDLNLVGMNFLSSLKGWRVEGDELVLNP